MSNGFGGKRKNPFSSKVTPNAFVIVSHDSLTDRIIMMNRGMEIDWQKLVIPRGQRWPILSPADLCFSPSPVSVSFIRLFLSSFVGSVFLDLKVFCFFFLKITVGPTVWLQQTKGLRRRHLQIVLVQRTTSKLSSTNQFTRFARGSPIWVDYCQVCIL